MSAKSSCTAAAPAGPPSDPAASTNPAPTDAAKPNAGNAAAQPRITAFSMAAVCGLDSECGTPATATALPPTYDNIVSRETIVNAALTFSDCLRQEVDAINITISELKGRVKQARQTLQTAEGDLVSAREYVDKCLSIYKSLSSHAQSTMENPIKTQQRVLEVASVRNSARVTLATSKNALKIQKHRRSKLVRQMAVSYREWTIGCLALEEARSQYRAAKAAAKASAAKAPVASSQ